MSTEKAMKKRSSWAWIPSLYFAEGLPYTVVMLIAVVFYKRMGISNTEIALYTSWLYLPWVLKPFWSPLVDIVRTKRFWIVAMQILVGAGLGGVVLTIPMPAFFQFTLAFFWLLAFSSATHDIAADGFYMIALSQHEQAWWVGIRSTFYRLAIIAGQGGIIIFAGMIESNTGLQDLSLDVQASKGNQLEQQIDNSRLSYSQLDTDLAIAIQPSVLNVALGTQSSQSFDSLQAKVNYWNENRMEQINPMELDSLAFIGYTAPEPGDPVGNTAIAYIGLSSRPQNDEQTVVSFGHESGDKSIKLISDTRLVFNQDDWNIPYLAIIQVHPNLKHDAISTFIARSGNIPLAWIMSFGILTAMFAFFFVYHFFVLPKPGDDKGAVIESGAIFWKNYIKTFSDFFTKEKIGLAIAFILVYRFGEAQLVKIAPLFMIDSIEAGGLALTTQQYGFIYGTLGAIMLTLGGILGGFVSARQGLKYWILWMALAMKLPDVVYVYLSYVQPENFTMIAIMVGIEQFGYGFGFTAYMLYMITVAEGEHKTAHYAICTGFMALGMMIPGMFSGWLQETIGYQMFFIWVLVATIPGLVLLKYLPIDPLFGKKAKVEA
ncbi:MAG: MFS transporter [Candidatus Marinimicrobia bacterium]|jgi:PAT family beta-lactamase induction signal transducer AmpG|nr:MFS transporter [Candidatus Neomarinimicrobiota bacterium]MBT3574494.1 MFS transporter [Candidatus Neomarinimicrobiota bacterium]MBT3679807.1 MFS transporter [Candidatus Neomarinimicrobiota bacterium]MBT3950090.1 MFS transporter [Candidatus Neomarinimicrobiota bacterium]MBT4253976.1 MFS transporter [Candidatus Neomarinimicrobiota bacterium]